MKKKKLYQQLTMFAPIISLFCVIGVCAYEWFHLRELESNLTVTSGKVVSLDSEWDHMSRTPHPDRFPTELKSSKEESDFLNALQANAHSNRLDLINSTAAAGPPPEPPKEGADPKKVVDAVIPLNRTVEVKGSYQGTRLFMYNLLRSKRLLNLSDIKLQREKWPTVHLTFMVTRYVNTTPRGNRTIASGAVSPGSDSGISVTPVGGTALTAHTR